MRNWVCCDLLSKAVDKSDLTVDEAFSSRQLKQLAKSI